MIDVPFAACYSRPSIRFKNGECDIDLFGRIPNRPSASCNLQEAGEQEGNDDLVRFFNVYSVIFPMFRPISHSLTEI